MWIWKRCFHQQSTRNWSFSATTGEYLANGKPRYANLRKAINTPINQFKSIKIAANPFVPQWRYTLRSVVLTKCDTNCKDEKSSFKSGLSSRADAPYVVRGLHLIPGGRFITSYGKLMEGSDSLSGLIILHPMCHTLVHTKGIHVVKPAHESGLRKA